MLANSRLVVRIMVSSRLVVRMIAGYRLVTMLANSRLVVRILLCFQRINLKSIKKRETLNEGKTVLDQFTLKRKLKMSFGIK